MITAPEDDETEEESTNNQTEKAGETGSLDPAEGPTEEEVATARDDARRANHRARQLEEEVEQLRDTIDDLRRDLDAHREVLRDLDEDLGDAVVMLNRSVMTPSANYIPASEEHDVLKEPEAAGDEE